METGDILVSNSLGKTSSAFVLLKDYVVFFSYVSWNATWFREHRSRSVPQICKILPYLTLTSRQTKRLGRCRSLDVLSAQSHRGNKPHHFRTWPSSFPSDSIFPSHRRPAHLQHHPDRRPHHPRHRRLDTLPDRPTRSRHRNRAGADVYISHPRRADPSREHARDPKPEPWDVHHPAQEPGAESRAARLWVFEPDENQGPQRGWAGGDGGFATLYDVGYRRSDGSSGGRAGVQSCVARDHSCAWGSPI